MTLLKTLSSYQIATFIGCISFAVRNSHLEKEAVLLCPLAIKQKTYNQLGSLAVFKGIEKICLFALSKIERKKEPLLPIAYLKKNEGIKNKFCMAMHITLGAWALAELYLNSKSLVEDTKQMIEENDHSIAEACSGYLISSLLASVAKIQLACQTLFHNYRFFKQTDNADC